MNESKIKFQQFIISLLNKRGNIDLILCKTITSNKYIDLWYQAFTHKSYDKLKNYEYAEFIGDSIVNTCVSKYIIRWDSKIISVKYLTRLKNNIISKKSLALLAHSDGFFEFIRLGDGDDKIPGLLYYQNLDKEDLLDDTVYLSWLEDCFEAFIGTLSIILDKESSDISNGIQYCYNIIESFLDDSKISLKYEDVFDPKTRYKELCDKRWGFAGTVETTKLKNNEGKSFHKCKVYGYPYGDKTKDEKNKELLATVIERFKTNAEYQACEKAINILKIKFNISDYPQDPYKKFN